MSAAQRTSLRGWLLGALLVAAGLALALILAQPAPVATPAAPPVVVSPPIEIAPREGAVLAAADIDRISTLLTAAPAFRNDVLFLVIASARDRCAPAQRGDMARMASRAQLPVLGGISEVTATAPALDRPIYRYVQAAADAVRCGHAFTLGGPPRLELERYARGFPDTYFMPGRPDSVPSEYGGQALAQRANQPCQSIGYAVFPLAPPQWRCDAVRVGARRRILAHCEAMRMARGVDVTGELSPAFGEQLAAGVLDIVRTVPAGCR